MGRYIVDINIRKAGGCGTFVGVFFVLALLTLFIKSVVGRIVLGCFAALGIICLIWCIYCYKKDIENKEPSQKLKNVVSSNKWAVPVIISGILAGVLLIVSFSLGDIPNNSDTPSVNSDYSAVSDNPQ